MKVLFIDESGDHNLAVIDPQYPLFVLGGVMLEKDYAEGELTHELNAFKQEMFGRTNIVLHTADLTRNRNGFERLMETPFRERFYERLNVLMAKLRYTVVACAIRKDEHLARYGVAALDPYLLSLDVLVERLCFDIGDVAGGGGRARHAGRERRVRRRAARLSLGFGMAGFHGQQCVADGSDCQKKLSRVAKRRSAILARVKETRMCGIQPHCAKQA